MEDKSMKKEIDKLYNKPDRTPAEQRYLVDLIYDYYVLNSREREDEYNRSSHSDSS